MMPSSGVFDGLRSDVPTPAGSSRRAIYSKDNVDGERRTLRIRTNGCAGAKIDFSYVLVTLYFALRPQGQTELCEKDGLGREAEL